MTADQELLYLDVDDEITSAVARIRAARAQRLGLVLPHGSRLATSRINFRLLIREADTRGRALDIVSPDPAARALAAAAGLAAFASVSAFESGDRPAATPLVKRTKAGDDSPTMVIPAATAPRPTPVGRPTRRSGRRLGILLVILVLVTGAGGFGAANLLPSAEIVLVPATMTVGPLELSVTAQEGITQPDPTNLLVPAVRHDFSVEASDTFAATGVRVEETAATGSVLFQNCDTGRPVTIPAGSVVATSARVEFRTVASVTVARAGIFPFACKTGSVGVEAVLPGPEGNVEADRISRIPTGFDDLVLSVTNPAPTDGGSRTEFPVVAQADVDAALAALQAALLEAAAAKLEDGLDLPAGTDPFEETLGLGDTVPSTDPALLVGQEIAEFELGASADASVVGVDAGQVELLADARIRGGVGDGWRLVEDSIKVTTGIPLVTGRTIIFPASAEARAVREIDQPALLARIRGLEAHEARTILGEFGTVSLTLWPDWATRVPTIEGRITLRVEPGS